MLHDELTVSGRKMAFLVPAADRECKSDAGARLTDASGHAELSRKDPHERQAMIESEH